MHCLERMKERDNKPSIKLHYTPLHNHSLNKYLKIDENNLLKIVLFRMVLIASIEREKKKTYFSG